MQTQTSIYRYRHTSKHTCTYTQCTTS